MAHLGRVLNYKPRKQRIMRSSERDFTPIKWDRFFEDCQDIDIEGDMFRIYLAGCEGPVLVLLHGGGYSGLTWALFTKEILSRINCRILAIDLRGHGETHTSEDENLSLEYMTRDVLSVITKMGFENENVVFIGHSMGGALAVHCARHSESTAMLCVIDVVEGTALESLTSMQAFLRSRPKSFASLEAAIQWSYTSGQTQNIEAARVSMPGQIKDTKTGILAASDITSETNSSSSIASHSNSECISTSKKLPRKLPPLPIFKSPAPVSPPISEEETEENDTVTVAPNAYTWRIDLSKTEKYWRGWFSGLSQEFLNTICPKMLLLANIHGLDTTLTVGQMQGKFQIQVLPRCGHAIHEDLPDKVADIIATILVRHKLAAAVGDFTPMFPAC